MESDNSDDNDSDINDSDIEKLQQEKNKKSLKCSTCGKKFTNPYDRQHHEQTHSTDLPFKCPLCPYRAKTKKYIGTHKKRMHMEKKGPACKVCGKVFIYKSKMEEHMMVHTGEKPFKCEYCPKAFRVSYSLKSHLLIHSNEKPFECSFCNYSCRDSSTLRKHQNKHMGLSKFYDCNMCQKRFRHKYLLKDHISEFHMKMNLKKLKCIICEHAFKTNSLLRTHVRLVHDQIYASKCEICGVKVSNKYNLKNHMLTHLDYRPYRCTFRGCTKKFKTRSYLKKHSIIHKPDLHFKCEICGATFTRKHRLETHKNTHKERKKNVMCDYCDVSFYSKNYIIKHIKEKHSERQLYVCDDCGFKSKNKPGLVMHMKFGHLKCKQEKECKICHSLYKDYKYLKNHYLRTHNIKYKMVKPYAKIKVENEEVSVKVEPLDEDYATLSLLDIDKEEMQEADYSEYSRQVLSEDVTDCVFRPNENCDETEFDRFLRTHLFSNNKDGTNQPGNQTAHEEPMAQWSPSRVTELKESNPEGLIPVRGINNSEVTEECDPEILQKTKDRIAVLLNTSEKLRKAEKKRKAAKKLAEKKKKEEEELVKKQENELKELEILRLKYNEIISKLKSTPKKKENKKIIYYKANKEKISNENDSLEENVENDFGDDEIDFTVKPNKLCEKSNNDSNEVNNFDANNDVSNKNIHDSVEEDYSEEEISFAIKPANDKINETSKINDENNEIYENKSLIDETDTINDETNDIHDEIDKNDITLDEMNNKYDETNEIRVENKEIDNCHVKTNDDHVENRENDKIHDVQIENSQNDNSHDEINDELGEENVINDENSGSEKEIFTRSGRKLKPKKFFDDKNEKHPKLNFKSHQCYVCFKLYPTKEELIKHCQIHFDICSLRTLTKCPLCNYVTHKCLSHHILKKHDINLKINFQKIEEKTDKPGSKYYYNADGTIIDIIPSVKSLNFNANRAFEKQNRVLKNQTITKTKLVKNGTEWIVQSEDLETNFDLLPEFTETEYKKLKISDNYIDRFKEIYKLTKKRDLKMAFPCLDCPKICLNASALKLHNRMHQKNPKPFRTREEAKKERIEKEKISKNRKLKLNIDTRAPKPIKNNHKCDEKLKEFYENNIKGGDIEFWQFLKIFNKMDREQINEFEQLENRNDFGIHTMEDKRITVSKNNTKTSNTLKKKSNTLKKRNISTTTDSKVPNTNKNNNLAKNNKNVPNTYKQNRPSTSQTHTQRVP